MPEIKASVFHPAQCYLGEGPMWHPTRRSCFWTNIDGFGFYEYDWDSGKVEFYKTDFRVSLVIPSAGERLLLGVQGGVAGFDLAARTFSWLLDLEKEYPNTRCNDGACDSRGRLWIGTMDRQFKPGAGSLYCIDQSLQPRKAISGTTISNGMCWSQDNKLFYYIDTPTQKVQSYFFDEATGALRFRKDIIHVPKEQGSPDGMAMDEEGMLWIAHWGGFGIYRWDPGTGKQIGEIRLPVPNVSSCAFVGDNLDQLLITTASQDLGAEEMKKYPHSGDVFIADPRVRGVPARSCTI